MFKCSIRCEKIFFGILFIVLGLSAGSAVKKCFNYIVQCEILALSAVSAVHFLKVYSSLNFFSF